MANIELVPLEETDREQFIKDNQEAFNHGALEEFGRRDDHFEEDGEIISRETIDKSIDGGEAYRIMQDVNDGAMPKYYVECCHEAIIDRETFLLVQEELARRSELHAFEQIALTVISFLEYVSSSSVAAALILFSVNI